MTADATNVDRHDETSAARGGRAAEAQVAEQERQLREVLEHCPAALNIVDDEGRLLFHNWRLRELLGYGKEELELFDTKRFWHDLDHRARIVERLRERGGQVLNEEVVWKTKQGQLLHLLISYVQVAYQGGHISFSGAKRICWVVLPQIVTLPAIRVSSILKLAGRGGGAGGAVGDAPASSTRSTGGRMSRAIVPSRMIRRARRDRQAFTARWTVRTCRSSKMPGCRARSRSRTATAERVGSSASQASISPCTRSSADGRYGMGFTRR